MLNGNETLSKDRLSRVRASLHFNNSENYIQASSSSHVDLLNIGSDCGVFFVQNTNIRLSSTVKATRQRNKGKRISLGEVGSITKGVDKGSWWIGRVERFRKKVNGKWGLSRDPIDLHNRPTTSDGCVQIWLSWFDKVKGKNKFKYNISDCQWIDINSIICTVNLTYDASLNIYTMNEGDASNLHQFVKNKM